MGPMIRKLVRRELPVLRLFSVCSIDWRAGGTLPAVTEQRPEAANASAPILDSGKRGRNWRAAGWRLSERWSRGTERDRARFPGAVQAQVPGREAHDAARTAAAWASR